MLQKDPFPHSSQLSQTFFLMSLSFLLTNHTFLESGILLVPCWLAMVCLLSPSSWDLLLPSLQPVRVGCLPSEVHTWTCLSLECFVLESEKERQLLFNSEESDTNPGFSVTMMFAVRKDVVWNRVLVAYHSLVPGVPRPFANLPHWRLVMSPMSVPLSTLARLGFPFSQS